MQCCDYIELHPLWNLRVYKQNNCISYHTNHKRDKRLIIFHLPNLFNLIFNCIISINITRLQSHRLTIKWHVLTLNKEKFNLIVTKILIIWWRNNCLTKRPNFFVCLYLFRFQKLCHMASKDSYLSMSSSNCSFKKYFLCIFISKDCFWMI